MPFWKARGEIAKTQKLDNERALRVGDQIPIMKHPASSVSNYIDNKSQML